MILILLTLIFLTVIIGGCYIFEVTKENIEKRKKQIEILKNFGLWVDK